MGNDPWKILRQTALLVLILTGEILYKVSMVPIPGNILGMLLLRAGLLTGIPELAVASIVLTGIIGVILTVLSVMLFMGFFTS